MLKQLKDYLFYQDDWATIYCGDCLEIMPLMEPESVDLVVTSPPYNIDLDYGTYEDNLPQTEFVNLNKIYLLNLLKVMAKNSRMYIAVREKMLYWFKQLAEEMGFIYAQILIWCKPNFIGGTKRISGDWNNMTDFFLSFYKGKRTPMKRADEFGINTVNWFVITAPQSNFNEGREHPAQWPIRLGIHLIDRTPSNIILDPFLGSGTTCVAAKNLNRKSIGIEINPKYCEIAVKRLRQEVFDFRKEKK
jgi:DNA modification methylase